jgi:hypothetical protein
MLSLKDTFASRGQFERDAEPSLVFICQWFMGFVLQPDRVRGLR